MELSKIRAMAGPGATVEDDGCRYVATCRPGWLWVCDDVHEVVAHYGGGTASERSETRADLAQRIAYGVTPCTDPGCDWCAGGDA